MNEIVLIGGLLLAGLIGWLLMFLRRRSARMATEKLNGAFQRLQELDVEIRDKLEESAQRGTTISIDKVLKDSERLRQHYISLGQEEDARTVERSMKEFREKYGLEIPVDVAYALATEIEAKHESQLCKKCGMMSQPGERFCTKCGYPLVFIPSDQARRDT